jgi:hypothetical protein
VTRYKVLFQHLSGVTEEDLKGSQDSWPQAIYLSRDLNMSAVYSTKMFSFHVVFSLSWLVQVQCSVCTIYTFAVLFSLHVKKCLIICSDFTSENTVLCTNIPQSSVCVQYIHFITNCLIVNPAQAVRLLTMEAQF